MKKIVLELLKLALDAKSEMSVQRLERLTIIKSKEPAIQGLYFISYLEELKSEKIIDSNSNKSIYFITQKGLDLLKTI